MIWIAVAVGGALGSLGRYGVTIMIGRTLGHAIPLATALVNVAGCLCIGALAGAAASGRLPLTPAARGFVMVGVLGGFTTFSSFGLDTLMLVQEGRRLAAFWNVAGQIGIGLAAVFFGYALVVRST